MQVFRANVTDRGARHGLRFIGRIVMAALFLASVPLTAHAYIDPGTGIALWQGLLIAIGAVVAFIKNPFSFFKRDKRKDDADQ